MYLPRVRYPIRADVQRFAATRPSLPPRAHQVSAHLRRSPTVSPTQRALAELHRWTIAEGFTFVRPHKRGTREVDVLYRSRSALHTLYEVAEVPDRLALHEWFEFEASVPRVLSERSLVVEQVQRLDGSDGIAVFAIDEASDAEGIWLVHGLRGDRVGPGGVARLVEAMAQAPTGTRGLIATTGAPTATARTDAVQAGITVVERIAGVVPAPESIHDISRA
jgi:hypothetical protein